MNQVFIMKHFERYSSTSQAKRPIVSYLDSNLPPLFPRPKSHCHTPLLSLRTIPHFEIQVHYTSTTSDSTSVGPYHTSTMSFEHARERDRDYQSPRRSSSNHNPHNSSGPRSDSGNYNNGSNRNGHRNEPRNQQNNRQDLSRAPRSQQRDRGDQYYGVSADRSSGRDGCGDYRDTQNRDRPNAGAPYQPNRNPHNTSNHRPDGGYSRPSTDVHGTHGINIQPLGVGGPVREDGTSGGASLTGAEEETDPKILAKRLEAIRVTKQRPVYEAYLLAVPKDARDPKKKHANHPRTPPFNSKMSKRRYTGLFDQWVGLLHGWGNGKQGYDSLEEMKIGRVQQHLDGLDQEAQLLHQNHQFLGDQDQNYHETGQDGRFADSNQFHVDQGDEANCDDGFVLDGTGAGAGAAEEHYDDEEAEALAEALRLAEAL